MFFHTSATVASHTNAPPALRTSRITVEKYGNNTSTHAKIIHQLNHTDTTLMQPNNSDWPLRLVVVPKSCSAQIIYRNYDTESSVSRWNRVTPMDREPLNANIHPTPSQKLSISQKFLCKKLRENGVNRTSLQYFMLDIAFWISIWNFINFETKKNFPISPVESIIENRVKRKCTMDHHTLLMAKSKHVKMCGRWFTSIAYNYTRSLFWQKSKPHWILRICMFVL